MPTYTNTANVPLSLAVFLATDNYDYAPGTISATGLLKSARQAVLPARVPTDLAQIEVVSLLKARLGTAIHDSIEKAWLNNYATAMQLLQYPQEVIDRVVINPAPEDLTEDALPVYMEQRKTRKIDNTVIRGKFDFVAEGRLEDFKSTSTYTWILGTKDRDHQLQGSIYRWLAPDVITVDHMAIQYIFTDWKPGLAASDPKYPAYPIMSHKIPLLPVDETEHFIRGRLQEFERCQALPEAEIPYCTPTELWQKDPVYKYYRNPQKRARATKNFTSSADAYARLAADGNVGVVVESPGEVVACKYCAAFPICTQKDELLAMGALKL